MPRGASTDNLSAASWTIDVGGRIFLGETQLLRFGDRILERPAFAQPAQKEIGAVPFITPSISTTPRRPRRAVSSVSSTGVPPPTAAA
jgi:hypothetical protein